MLSRRIVGAYHRRVIRLRSRRTSRGILPIRCCLPIKLQAFMILEPAELTTSGRPALQARELELMIYDQVSEPMRPCMK